MSTKKTVGRAAAGVAVLAAALPLSTGAAHAQNLMEMRLLQGGDNGFACVLSGSLCGMTVDVSDTTTPVVFKVNGTVVTAPYIWPCVPADTCVSWTPKTGGHYVLTAEQGILSQTLTVDIIDRNSPLGLLMQVGNTIIDNSGSAGHVA